MMELSPDEIREVRRKALKIEFRAKADPNFLEQLKDDPVATLRAEGFEEELAREFGVELRGTSPGQTPNIPGLGGSAEMPTHGCDGITCWITSCSYWTGW